MLFRSLRRVIVPVANERDREAVKMMESVILDEVNVKAIEYVSDSSEIVHKRAKPNFKVIGPKFGKSVQAVANTIRSFGAKELRELETTGSVEIDVDGKHIRVTKADVEIVHEDIKGWQVESDGELTVALDTELTDDLIYEGMAREFVNRVQNMRKDAGFEVTDRIRIHYQTSDRFRKAISSLHEYVQNETLAVELSHGFKKGEHATRWELNGETCEIGIERVGPVT